MNRKSYSLVWASKMCACFEAALRRTQLNIFSGFGPFIRQNNTFEYAHLDDLESLNLWLKQQGVVANPKEPTWLYVCFMIPPSLQNAAKQLIRLRAFFILLLAKKKQSLWWHRSGQGLCSEDWGYAMVVSCQSQGSHTLKPTLHYCLFYSTWDNNLDNMNIRLCWRRLESSDWDHKLTRHLLLRH